jgi:hypothetical protein
MQHDPMFQLWILCMDDGCYDILEEMELPNVHLVSLAELENKFPGLLEAKKNRTVIEYYFTCTPALPLYVLDTGPSIEDITYLDADLFFFADPAPIYEEIADHSIAIIEHRFPRDLSHLAEYGIFNVGFIYFRKDETGLACLRRWLEQCLEWCYDRVDGDRFADQKYLDAWPDRFENLRIVQHKGANLAPWNLANYAVTFRRGQSYVDGQPLIFFHFHGLRRVSSWLFETNLEIYNVRTPTPVLNRIYKPYIRAISRISERYPGFAGLFLSDGLRLQTQKTSPSSGPSNHPLDRIIGALRWRVEACYGIYHGKYILFLGGPSLE